jgi:O-antigen/teichoic acid export membrane protein
MLVQFISPLFLVRILSPVDYGLYQEFIVFAMLSVSFIEFSTSSNLLYFVPRDSDRERAYITGTVFLNLLFTAIGVVAIIMFRDQIGALTSWDITKPMLAYVITYVNFDFLEIYWIATRRTTNVLYYGLTLAILRTLVVVLVAHYTQSVLSMVYALVAFQTAKCLFVGAYLLRKRLLLWRVNRDVVRAQMRFIVPLGAAAVVLYFNNEISKVIVSTQLGAIALAMYSVGSRQIPFTGIIRASVSDVVFPEIVRLNTTDPRQGLALWKRTNLIQTFFVAPIFFSAFFYADVIITTLFTVEYIKAVPIFRIYLLLILFKDSIEMGAPLRAMHRNRVFIYGNVLSLAVNVGLLYALFRVYPYYGPAAAFVATTAALQVFLGAQIIRAYGVRLRELFLWRKHVYIAGAAVFSVFVMQLGEILFGTSLATAAGFGILYFAVYLMMVRFLRIGEIDAVLLRTVGRLRGMLART